MSSKGVPNNLKMDDLWSISPMDPDTIRRAQLNAADMLGPDCGDILDMLGIRQRVS